MGLPWNGLWRSEEDFVNNFQKFRPSTMQILGIKLRVSGLAARALTLRYLTGSNIKSLFLNKTKQKLSLSMQQDCRVMREMCEQKGHYFMPSWRMAKGFWFCFLGGNKRNKIKFTNYKILPLVAGHFKLVHFEFLCF